MLQKQPHDSGAVKDIPDRPAIVPATVTEIPNMTYLDTLPHSRPRACSAQIANRFIPGAKVDGADCLYIYF